MTVHANRSWKILTIALGTLAVALVTVFGSGLGPVEAGLPGPLQVTVTVSASDPGGNPLTYRWRSSDGQIANVNAPTTTWTLADGPGLHFAYVLASNGHGGYTEQRVVVNTDTIGTPIQTYPPVTLQAPPAAIPVGETYRRFTFRPDLLFYAQDDSNTLRVPATGYVKSDLKEQIILRGITPVLSPPVTMNLFCSIAPGGPFDVCGQIVPDIGTPTPPTNLPPNLAVSDTHFRPDFVAAPGTSFFSGQVLLADGAVCGTQSEFFGVEATAVVELRNAANALVGGPFRVNAYGFYDIYTTPSAIPTTLVVRCENAPPVPIAIPAALPGDLGLATIPGSGRPVVTSITAKLPNGTVVGLFQKPSPSSASLPSDNVKESFKFLAYKGLDSRMSGCMYYKAVGAVKSCDRLGNMVGAVRFDDWKRTVQIGAYARPGFTEYAATYINKADLNLTRNHHSISYGPSQTAGYVCNHAGPSVLDPGQAEIDQVIDNAVNGKNLVACVAMDYATSPGVNGGQPFVRFLIFGPSGELLPSVNLDGRAEKFVPGTCVVCHGADHYTARYPETGAGPANIGAHFLPYDVGNFLFSSKPGLREVDQEAAIRALNQNVLNAGPTVAAQELITGWYAGGTFNKDYLPASWQGRGQLAADFYRKVIATSCRGCHVNMPEGFNWDHYPNVNQTVYRSTDLDAFYASIGDCDPANPLFRMHSMPNSAVTFNRFWNTKGTANDLPKLLDDFLASEAGPGRDPVNLTCTPTRP